MKIRKKQYPTVNNGKIMSSDLKLSSTSKGPLYLDYQATTPLDPRALEAMMPYLTDHFGNPHSASHSFGWRAEAGLDIGREQIAEALGGKADEVTFTSGATEANSLIIIGLMQRMLPQRPHLITVATEHSCVLEAAKMAQKYGAEVTFLPVQPDGLIDLDLLRDHITKKTGLISVMMVNNEIGVVQDIDSIGRLAKENDILFHCDAAQAFGKIPLDVRKLSVDYLSLSAHKIYGPKGIGALWHRQGAPQPAPLIVGGGQEKGWRSGTQAPALVAGFGMAAEIAVQEREAEAKRIMHMSTAFSKAMTKALPNSVINGSRSQRWQGNLNMSFPGVDGNRLLADLSGLALSSGSACASAQVGPSYVLQALGLPENLIQSALRIGFGRYIDYEQVMIAADQIIHAVRTQISD